MACIVIGILGVICGLGMYLGADAKLNSFDFWWENAGSDTYEQVEMMRSMGIMVAVLGVILLIVGIVLVIVKKGSENRSAQQEQMMQNQQQLQQIQQQQFQQQLFQQQMYQGQHNIQTEPVANAIEIKCPRCGGAATDAMRFCPMCGLDLKEAQAVKEKKCKKCGSILMDDALFCTECGTKIEE